MLLEAPDPNIPFPLNDYYQNLLRIQLRIVLPEGYGSDGAFQRLERIRTLLQMNVPVFHPNCNQHIMEMEACLELIARMEKLSTIKCEGCLRKKFLSNILRIRAKFGTPDTEPTFVAYIEDVFSAHGWEYVRYGIVGKHLRTRLFALYTKYVKKQLEGEKIEGKHHDDPHVGLIRKINEMFDNRKLLEAEAHNPYSKTQMDAFENSQISRVRFSP